jgi:WD40 repeat protein
LWDAQSGELQRTLSGDGEVGCCAWSPDGASLLAGTMSGTLHVFDAATGTLVQTIHNLPDHQWATTANNKFLAASPEAWRFLAWCVTDASGRSRLLPAEYFGPLPVVESPPRTVG